MNFNYPQPSGLIRDDGSYRHFGHVTKSETDSEAVTVDLVFRMATNGVIVNTLVNDEPIFTTGAGQFR